MSDLRVYLPSPRLWKARCAHSRASGRCWVAVHAQQHLAVYKHELEMEAIRIIRVELLCRVENWFVDRVR
jgi:hypothetical protein